MRYCRQNLVKVLGKDKQKLISKKIVGIVGLGALGSRVVELLVRAGVKKFVLIDRDSVEDSNLSRQTLYVESDIGKSKVSAIANHLIQIDNAVQIKDLILNLDSKDCAYLLGCDLIVDCTDNQETKLLLNKIAVKDKIPLVYGTVLGTRGYVFNVVKSSSCLECFMKEPTEFLGNCETHGVLNTACSLIATIQANESLKILSGQKCEENLIRADIWDNSIEKIKVPKNKKCKVC